ncbi:MAG TPA: phenylalanine--tRNA ligase subunit beta, partial [Opitutae bacterium]|nr:phenylalanine--tRNA ligase subunit beta [Opitutae bacterium]
MKISFDWLKRYVDLSVGPEALLEVLPKIGFEVDSMERRGLPLLESIVVGEVLTREKHPDADKLSVCTVTVGEGDPLNIVCGAHNCDVGNRVIVAQVGARMPEGFKIKRSKLRGVPSEGMLCSARELGLGQDHEGIYILDQGHPLGTPINDVFP